ncbi:GNAT family N-acetyltransferase [Paenibacillus sp. UNC451MF]|uniref:GNAT family N-acetyltransferase n=1 Tax=Paenibacillus sp. UNC451MF TaxID=1449063 RepID=UPI000691D517|nr:GNAT family N-acetyltransferase [Paenibacillus sp. UNC451MF]
MGSLNTITIRDAAANDKEAIQQVMLASYVQYEAVMSPPRWEAYREGILAAVDSDRALVTIIAERDGVIIGSMQMFVSSEAAYGRPEMEIHSPIIRYLSVLPSVRGQGVATELILESVRRTASLGASVLHLHTSDLMQSAVRLYERLGFERAYDKDFYNGETLVKSYRMPLHANVLEQLSSKALRSGQASHSVD